MIPVAFTRVLVLNGGNQPFMGHEMLDKSEIAAKISAHKSAQLSWREGEAKRRYEEFVERAPEGCWGWDGHVLPKGYGCLGVGGKTFYAHRLSYEIHIGPIPPGKWVLHHCDNPVCSNPDHLFIGTQKDNLDDMRRKGRGHWASGERHGNSRLTTEKARAIYQDSRTHQEVADEYGIGETAVRDIRHRKTWRKATEGLTLGWEPRATRRA